jgi:TRAP-type C4-dicarboxylate transport system substrate-binding protein
MEAKGLIKLGFVSGGSRSMYARQPVRTLGDLTGKKIRTMEDPIYLDTWNALGALATPIPWGDVYLSLDQGIVDGAEGALISYQSMGFYDPSPHVTVIDYIFSWHNFMMSKLSWDKLSAQSQKLIKDAAKAATEFERNYVVEVEKKLLDVLKTKHGAKIYYPDDIEQWRKAVSGIYQKRAADVGGMDLINQILNTGK